MKVIWAKVGTTPACQYRALRKKNDPKVGDKLMLRGYGEFDWEDFQVRVCEIKGNYIVNSLGE